MPTPATGMAPVGSIAGIPAVFCIANWTTRIAEVMYFFLADV
jgi:hypothetical protein